jgi:hypothetical protein
MDVIEQDDDEDREEESQKRDLTDGITQDNPLESEI